MASRQTLTITPKVSTRFELEDALAPLQIRRYLTGSQAHTIIMASLPELPCALKIEQRTPKGITYVTANNSHFIVNQRGKLARPS